MSNSFQLRLNTVVKQYSREFILRARQLTHERPFRPRRDLGDLRSFFGVHTQHIAATYALAILKDAEQRGIVQHEGHTWVWLKGESE